VTAVRAEQKVFDAPTSVEVINNKTLFKKAARSTPEILMTATGVFLQKTNHGGSSPFVRGLIGNQTLLLVDGIRLNNSTFRQWI
jgi:hemoglobin/transferrin/lactoferrin receptor protein